MDKTLILSMIASFFAGIFGNISSSNYNDIRGVDAPTVKEARQLKLPYKEESLTVAWAEVKDPSKVALHLNLTEKVPAYQAFEDKNCEILVNGGFYSKENNPIGLFIANGIEINPIQKNSLFNGVLGITKEGKAQITDNNENYQEAVQTGPILVKDGVFKELNMKNDSPERRMVALTTKEDKLIFLSYYNHTSYYLGANLEDLPGLLKSFEHETGIGVKDAINLDGGTASALYGDSISLTELKPIGSYFCETK